MLRSADPPRFSEPAQQCGHDVCEPGPQGAALILELQRLRHAFDGEISDRPRIREPSRDGFEPRRQRRHGPARRGKQSRVKQAIEICLQPFRPKAGMAGEMRQSPKGSVPPPRRRSPPIAPSEPVLMNLKAAPAMAEPGELNESELPGCPAPASVGEGKPEPSIGQLIQSCCNGVRKSTRFLLNSGSSAVDTADASVTSRVGRAFEGELRTGLRILAITLLLGGCWMVFMPLAGAVVVPGNLVVQSNVKQIQHPTGGVVAEIRVQNGSRVNAGDLLVRLDAIQARASLQVVTKQLDEVRARVARLTAERDGLAGLKNLALGTGDIGIGNLMESEAQLFEARLSARQSQKELLESQASQFGEQISGFEAQMDSKAKQLDLIRGELVGVQDLYDKRLVPLTRLTTLQREAARIEGERGQLMSAIAETKSKIDASKLQIVRIDQDFRSDVVKELNEAQAKEAELAERGIAARDLLDRIEIHAPASGVVNQLSIHTIGGVVRAGETILEIVPDADDLQVEARVNPNDIDHVRTGQNAFVRFTAFNQRTTPQLNGTVSYVSADTGHDQQTNAAYFTVRIVLAEGERRRLNGQQLLAGMPAEVFMQTGSRTMMSYLLDPIADQMRRAFVER